MGSGNGELAFTFTSFLFYGNQAMLGLPLLLGTLSLVGGQELLVIVRLPRNCFKWS